MCSQDAKWRAVSRSVLLVIASYCFSGCEAGSDGGIGAGDPCVELEDVEACFEAGLVCQFSVCGPPAAKDAPCDSQWVFGEGVNHCEDGLMCYDGTCIVPGGLDQPCRALEEGLEYNESGEGCDAGLYCVRGFCMVVGGENQPCRGSSDEQYENPSGVCDDGLYCTEGTCIAVAG